MAHRAADTAIAAIQAAEQGLDRARTVPDEGIRAALRSALESAHEGGRFSYDAIFLVTTISLSAGGPAHVSQEAAGEALFHATGAFLVVRQAAAEIAEAQAELEACRTDNGGEGASADERDLPDDG